MKKLEDLIKEKILSEGPITFHDFMEMALYYLELGYYRQGKEQIGEFGDFYTSPVTHPIFGALLAIQIEQMWQILGRPPDFTVVEMGSGKGLLASDILSYLPLVSPELAGNIIYLAIEHGNAGRICSSSLMQSTGSNSSRDKLSGEPENIIGCFLSNEFFDALPTHRVIVQNGELKEIYVGLDRGNFVEITCNLSTNQVYQRLKDENVILEEGQYGEINLQVPYWVDWMGQRLSRGFVLSIDYGYTAKELYSTSRYQGTVMTYYRHIEGRNPYIRVGEQDISSHVDFTAVLEAGEKKGLQALSLVTQKEFLQNLGIRSFLQALRLKGLSYQEYSLNRYSMIELLKSEGFGDFKVLIQSRGITPGSLYSLTLNKRNFNIPTNDKGMPHIPLLDDRHMAVLLGKYPHLAAYDEIV